MTNWIKVTWLVLLVVALGYLNTFAQSFPSPYKGELNACGKVSGSLKEGKSLESAIVNLFLWYSDQPTPFYRSIQRAIIRATIQDCHLDGTEVVRAALRIDMNLPLLVLSMSEAGVDPQTLRDALQQAGLDHSSIEEAFRAARLGDQTPALDYAGVLPAPFQVFSGGTTSGSTIGSGGLGQASPFMP